MDKAKEDTPFVVSAVPADGDGAPPGGVHRLMSVSPDELRGFTAQELEDPRQQAQREGR
jgi:hypothetical protein